MSTYGERARAAHPGYVIPGAPCDVPDCGQPVTGSRTITLVGQRRQDDVSVLVRLCAAHTGMRYSDLVPLLPALAGLLSAAGSPERFGTDAS